MFSSPQRSKRRSTQQTLSPLSPNDNLSSPPNGSMHHLNSNESPNNNLNIDPSDQPSDSVSKNTKNSSSSKLLTPAEALGAIKNIKSLFKPYKGDIFGTRGGENSGGLMYLSRMNISSDPVKMLQIEEAKRVLEEEKIMRPNSVSESTMSNVTTEKSQVLLEKKRRFAISLATLSSKPFKRSGIVRDGAIITLVTLSKQSDRQTQLSCASAFNSLASSQDVREAMMKQGAVNAIVSLSLSPLRKIKNDCARAICNLAASHDVEEELVKLGVVNSLLSISTSSVQLMEVALMSLLNLSCVDERYAQIDSVNDAVLHLGGFSMSPSMEVMLVSCICNLAALKNNQARLVEEGCVRLLTRITKTATLSTLKLCAYAFCNLSSCSRSRGKMTDQRVIPTLLELVRTNDEVVKRQCALTISRIAMDVSCREKVVQQGAVSAIVEMCVSNERDENDLLANIETDRVCSAALNVLSLDLSSSLTMINSNAVLALVILIDTGDAIVRQDCAQCLCVLFQCEAGVNKMIEHGAVEALVKLADTSVLETCRNCALALFNLLSHDSADKIAGRGILQALIRLSQSTDEATKRTCAAALWELTTLSTSNAHELIPALIKMLRDESGDSQIKGDCAAALYDLAQDFGNCEMMMKEKCLDPLLSLVESENFGTRVQCGAILSRLSFQREYRAEMNNAHFMRALFNLANIECDQSSEVNAQRRVLKTQQRMINAIYNLSCEKDARPLLMEEGAGKFLTFFQTKPAENIRRGCAAALCNLLCDEGTEVPILECGAVSALLITALVASDKEETKKICTKCLYNLLSSEKCHVPMVKDGVLWGFAALLKSSTDSNALTEDLSTLRMCSRAFCNLSCDFSKEFITSTACIKTLLQLTAVDDLIVQDFAARGLLNVLSYVSKTAELKGGVNDGEYVSTHSVKYLKNLSSSSSPQVCGLCVLSFCIISQFPSSRLEIMEQQALPCIDFNIASLDPELSYAYAGTLCNLAMERETLSSVVVPEGLLSNLLLLCRSTEERTVFVVARALYYCSCDPSLIPTLIKLGIVEGMQELLLSQSLLDNQEMHTYMASCFFNVSTENGGHLEVVNKDAVRTIRVLWEHGSEEIKRICGLATANLSCGSINSSKIVSHLGTEMIVTLALSPLLSTHDGRWCVAALRNLLSTSANHRLMLKEGAVDALVVLAANKDGFIARNSAVALRAMTYNQATREALIEKNAINVILEDESGKEGRGGGGGGGDDDDLKIANGLLQQIEAESWANGSRGAQRQGRPEEIERSPLLTDLIEPEPVLVEVPSLHMGWNKVEHHTAMEEPALERAPKKSAVAGTVAGAVAGAFASAGEHGSNLKKDASYSSSGKDADVDIKVPTKFCSKMECDTISGVFMVDQESKRPKRSTLDEASAVAERNDYENAMQPASVNEVSGSKGRESPSSSINENHRVSSSVTTVASDDASVHSSNSRDLFRHVANGEFETLIDTEDGGGRRSALRNSGEIRDEQDQHWEDVDDYIDNVQRSNSVTGEEPEQPFLPILAIPIQLTSTTPSPVFDVPGFTHDLLVSQRKVSARTSFTDVKAEVPALKKRRESLSTSSSVASSSATSRGTRGASMRHPTPKQLLDKLKVFQVKKDVD